MSTSLMNHRTDRGTDAAPLGSEARSLLYGILYGEVFSQALTEAEILSYRLASVGASANPTSDEPRLQDLVGTYVEQADGLFFPAGRDDLPAIRARRRATAPVRWRIAERYASWLRHLPFVRMVAVCGSLAVENTEADGDVDLFLVAEDGRLWIVHAVAMVARRLAGRPGVKVCPNLLLSRSDLAVPEPNLYRAREVIQVVPLWGEAVYDEFLAANAWVHQLLPDADLEGRRRRLRPGAGSRLQALLEKALPGPVAGLLDRTIHRILVAYFQLRWRRHDPSGRAVKQAYSRHRQLSVGGGYGDTIRRRFVELVRRRLGDGPEIERDLDRFFPAAHAAAVTEPAGVAKLFDEILTEDYGDPTVEVSGS